MAESEHPIVRTSPGAVRRPTPAGTPDPPRASSGSPRWSGLSPSVLLAVGAFLLGLVSVLGLASLVGEPVRNAAFIETDVGSAGSELVFTDAPEEAARFFAERDSVTVRVPWDMTVAELLALYHLEANASARDALRRTLGAAELTDPLRAGDEITFDLTRTRTVP